jgi:hypothetical protein
MFGISSALKDAAYLAAAVEAYITATKAISIGATTA